MQITGPSGPPGAPAQPVVPPIAVDPKLAARRQADEKLKQDLEALKRYGEQQKPGVFTGPNIVPVILEPVTDAVKSAVSPSIDTFSDKVIKGKAEDIVLDKVFRSVGFVAEKIGFAPGKILDFISGSAELGGNEEAAIAAQEQAERARAAQQPKLQMPPIWEADP